MTVGLGVLPEELGNPDCYRQMLYTPVVPVGRTVNAAMTEEDKEGQAAYSKVAFGVDMGDNKPLRQSENKTMPPGLGRVMGVLHDELSKRTSGELPSDYDETIKPAWATPFEFDLDPGYDASWLLSAQSAFSGKPRCSRPAVLGSSLESARTRAKGFHNNGIGSSAGTRRPSGFIGGASPGEIKVEGPQSIPE